MNESNTWDFMKIVLPLGHYSRIESHDTAPGFPDVHYQIPPGICGTMELKCAKNAQATIPFPADSEQGGLRRSQLKWIKDNLEFNGTVWIVAEVTPYIHIIPGSRATKFNGATRLQLFEISKMVLNRKLPKQAAEIMAALLIDHQVFMPMPDTKKQS